MWFFKIRGLGYLGVPIGAAQPTLARQEGIRKTSSKQTFWYKKEEHTKNKKKWLSRWAARMGIPKKMRFSFQGGREKWKNIRPGWYQKDKQKRKGKASVILFWLTASKAFSQSNIVNTTWGPDCSFTSCTPRAMYKACTVLRFWRNLYRVDWMCSSILAASICRIMLA